MRPKTIGARYLLVGAVFAAFVALLVAIVRTVPAPVIRGAASLRYFQTATADTPDERVERPARAYMNLLELPVLFYAVSLLMLTTGTVDSIQVSLAWVFVAARYAQALIHIGFNYVPLRFTTFLAGATTLAVIWTRFAQQNLNWPFLT